MKVVVILPHQNVIYYFYYLSMGFSVWNCFLLGKINSLLEIKSFRTFGHSNSLFGNLKTETRSRSLKRCRLKSSRALVVINILFFEMGWFGRNRRRSINLNASATLDVFNCMQYLATWARESFQLLFSRQWMNCVVFWVEEESWSSTTLLAPGSY